MLRLSGTAQKYIVYGVELFIVYIIQFTPSLLPAFFGESPMLLTVCAVSIALFEGDITGMFFGMAAGLLINAGSTAPFSVGVSVVVSVSPAGSVTVYAA